MYCRCCLATNLGFVAVSYKAAEIFKVVTGLPVKLEYAAPVFCMRCDDFLKKIVTFQEKCLEVDRMINDLVSTDVEVNDNLNAIYEKISRPNLSVTETNYSICCNQCMEVQIQYKDQPDKIIEHQPEKLIEEAPKKIEEEHEIKIEEQPEIIIEERPEIKLEKQPEIIKEEQPEIIIEEQPEIIIEEQPEIIIDEQPEIMIDEQLYKIIQERPYKMLEELPEKNIGEEPEMIKDEPALIDSMIIDYEKCDNNCNEPNFINIEDDKIDILEHDIKIEISSDEEYDFIKLIDEPRLTTIPVKTYINRLKEKNLQALKRNVNNVEQKQVEKSFTPYTCDNCLQEFKSKCDIKRHILTQHLNRKIPSVNISLQKESLECRFCSKVFKNTDMFKRHLLLHDTKRKYECHICSYRFRRQSDRTSHIEVHNQTINTVNSDIIENGLYKCGFCKREFIYNSDLKRHLMIHTGHRPFSCNLYTNGKLCKKAYIQKGDLVKHIRTHTGGKPYHCDLCPKAFRYSSHFRRHQREHKK